MKQIVKRILRSTGFEIIRYHLESRPYHRFAHSLRTHNIDLIFDVGANAGQFAKTLRDTGYTSTIVSFEPLSRAHAQLRCAASGDRNWVVFDRCAIGELDGSMEINIAANSVSSSVLPMLQSHSSAVVEAAYVGRETTPVRRLDTVSTEHLAKSKNPFIKIDTQGFEWQVLNGAPETLARSRGLMVELSLVPLYTGQRLWRDIIDRLEFEGFAIWGIQPGFVDTRNGKMLQVDAVFFR